jgi:hypothetical protein
MAKTVTSDCSLRAGAAAGKLSVSIRNLQHRERAVLRILSNRNNVLPALTDRSPHAPKREASKSSRATILNEQLYFAVVDLRLSTGMTGYARFEGESVGRGARYSANGMFHDNLRPATTHASIPGRELEHWENAIFVDRSDCRLTAFAIDVPVSLDDGAADVELDLLSHSWSGSVALLSEGNGDELKSTAVECPPPQTQVIGPKEREPVDRRAIEASLSATVRHLLRSQNRNAASRTGDGFFMFYDHDTPSFRTSHWNWTWGPVIRLMLDSRERLGDAEDTRREKLEAAALAAGKSSLTFQVDDPSSPADGFCLVRWSPGLSNSRQTGYLSPSDPDFPVDGWAPSHAGERFVRGFEAYISPADALFLAGWGWLPLARELDESIFLDATVKMADSTERLLDRFAVIPQDWPVEVGDWTDYTREEAAFGMVGLSELARATGDPRHKRIGERYIDGLLAKLERPDGLWNRHWWRSSVQSTTCEYKSRSLGWATMGLLAAHEQSPERDYLQKAAKLADHFIAHQHEPGYWGLVINKPIGATQVSVKGTAVWSWLLYRLFEATGDSTYLSAGRRALAWLLRQQYRGEDADGFGGLVSCSPFSGIDYRRWYRLSCSYSASFFGLALLAELSLRDKGRQ